VFRLLRKNSSKATFVENIKNFESLLNDRGHPASVVKKTPLRGIKIPIEKIDIPLFVSAILNKIIEHMVLTF